MGLACGIVGLPNVGKTTLFNALTGSGAVSANYAFSTTEANQAIVDLPDERLEVIQRYIETSKLVNATLTVVDIPGLAAGASQGEGMGNKFLGSVKESDALLHVVQCFDRADVARDSPVDPRADIELLELELAMADLETVTRNVERVAKKARAGDKDSIAQKTLFERAQELLEEGTQLRAVEWKPEERRLMYPMFLMTMKPVLYVANVGDDDVEGQGEHARAVAAVAEASGARWMALCGDLEAELGSMEPEDRTGFMEELGMKQLSLPRLINAAFDLLGLQTFFTAGPKEIKAWTIHQGDTGPVAAGVIHSDFERGYIRAEVFSVDDLVEHASEAQIKSAGKLRVEGRDYVMRDGDVVHFLVGK